MTYIFHKNWIANNVKYLLCLCISISFLSYAHSKTILPDPVYTGYSIDNGLSSNSIYEIVQDRTGYMWFGTQDGLNRFDGQKFHHYRSNPNDLNTLSSSNITALFIDSSGRLWVGTDNGLNLFDNKTGFFKHFKIAEGLSNNYINSINQISDELWIGTEKGINTLNLSIMSITQYPYQGNSRGTNHPIVGDIVDGRDFVWIATWGGGLNFYDKKNKTFGVLMNDPSDGKSLSSNAISSLHVDQSGTLWIGTFNSVLNRLNESCFCIERMQHSPDLNFVTWDIVEDSEWVWFATSAGLLKYDFAKDTFYQYDLLSQSDLGKGKRDIRSAYMSRDKVLWIGSEILGLLSIVINNIPFQSYYYGPTKPNGLASDDITMIQSNGGDKVLVGSAKGLHEYSISAAGSLSQAKFLLKARVFDSTKDTDDTRWLATSEGIVHVDHNFQTLKAFGPHDLLNDDLRNDIEISYAYSVITVPNGDIYVGMWLAGMKKISRDGEQYTVSDVAHKNTNGNSFESVYTFHLHNDTTLLLGTDNGVFVYSLSKNQFIEHQALIQNQRVSVSDIYEGTSGLWLASSKGAFLYDDNKRQFVRQDFNLSSDTVVSITDTSKNNIWISTRNGLYRYKSNEQVLTRFDKTYGLQSNAFNNRASLKLNDNVLLMGGVNGLSRLQTKKIKTNANYSKLKWTTLAYDKTGHINVTDEKDKINVPASVKNIELQYFVDDYTYPSLHQYRYAINDGDWLDNDNKSKVVLSELSAGEYTIGLQYKNVHATDWQDADFRVNIDVSRPFYLSYLAITFYVLFFVGAAIAIHIVMLRLAKKNEYKLSALIKERTSEITTLLAQKQQLFANVSHELRTPLTLIMAPLLTLSKQNNLTDEQKLAVNTAKTNSIKMSGLIDRIIDINNVSVREKNLSYIDVDTFLKAQLDSFANIKTYQKIVVEDFIASACEIYADERDLNSVIENLVANAFKYVSDSAWINITSVHQDQAYKLIVTNAHNGISASECNKVFERFERLGVSSNITGSGLGLALVKEICIQNGWDIYCTSQLNSSVTFTLTVRSKFRVIEHQQPSNVVFPPRAKDRSCILVIEDNLDIRQLVVNTLSTHFDVIVAANGEEGIEMAIEHIPDLIISDIVMPKVDGYQVLRHLRQHGSSSHIPIVILTASNSAEGELLALKMGSFDYIRKPFDPQHLFHKVINVVDTQKRLTKTAILNTQEGIKDETSASPYADVFFERLTTVIEKNYTNPDFSSSHLAAEMAMSERQLQRKLRATLSQSPNDYLRNYRLKVARELLPNGLSIIATAKQVGFRSQSYFSRSFKNKYGQTPSQFIQK